MKKYGPRCPHCNRGGSLAVAHNAVVQNRGPEGILHVIGCTKCKWHRTSSHYKGISQYAQLKDIIKGGEL